VLRPVSGSCRLVRLEMVTAAVAQSAKQNAKQGRPMEGEQATARSTSGQAETKSGSQLDYGRCRFLREVKVLGRSDVCSDSSVTVLKDITNDNTKSTENRNKGKERTNHQKEKVMHRTITLYHTSCANVGPTSRAV
jgi:hypothetical protein